MYRSILVPGLLLWLAFGVRAAPAADACKCPATSGDGLSNSQMFHLVQHVEMSNDRNGEHVNIAGTAQFHLTVDRNGRVTCAGRISGHPIASSLIIETVRKWRFTPHCVHGVAKATCGTLILKFSIVEGQSTVEAMENENH